jgi:sugar lactone lactonase YvrE
MTETITARLLASGFVFGEGPRWHQGRFWVADQHAHKVYTVSLDGDLDLMAELDDMPSGLGFLNDGSALIVAMRSQRVVRRATGGGLSEYADLSSLGPGWLNDMVVDDRGRAYLDVLQGPLYGGNGEPDRLAMVDIEGSLRVVADDVSLPNGLAVTPDNRTLVVAEFRGNRLTAFTIEVDGTLSDRRLFAQFDDVSADGICLDAEGAVWLASPRTGVFLRVQEGGQVTHRISPAEGVPIACVLGGPERRTLFMILAQMPPNAMARLRDAPDGSGDAQSGCVSWAEAADVAVGGAGWP